MTSSHAPFPVDAFNLLAEAESNNWWFRARNRVLLWILHSKIKNFHRLLEIGCGTGYVLSSIKDAFPKAELYGAEYYEEGLKIARQRVPSASFKQLDATQMSEKNYYDVIGAFDVLEHIEEDEKVFKNLMQALKPGGALLVSVPQHPWLWSAKDEAAFHVRRYTRRELINKASQAGFTIDYVTSFVAFLLPLMWLSRLRVSKENPDPMSEFKIPSWLNTCLEKIMQIELILLKIGICFPFGGSLLMLARKN